MLEDIDQIRRQRLLRELTASVIRAVGNDPAIHVRQHQFYQDTQPLRSLAPHLRLHNDEQRDTLRGVADSLALRVLYSDPALHQALTPAQPVARLVFDWLESLRTESLAPDTLPGIKANVQRRFYHWSAGYHREGHTESELGLLLYTVAQMCWSRISGFPVFSDTEDVIEATRFALTGQLGHALAGLRRHRHHQKDFARHALVIAHTVDRSVAHALSDQPEPNQPTDERLSGFALLLDFDDDALLGLPIAQPDQSATLPGFRQHYRIFDTRFDTETRVAERVRPAQLQEYREQINKRITAQKLNFNLLVHRMRRALMQTPAHQWVSDEEEGLVDGRRLTQLISSPLDRRVFRQPQQHYINDTSVTFLVDCSGSMKDNAETVTLMVDLLARGLERSGAVTEVLGFSTNDWNGGKPYRRWQAAGRPPMPGRLNAVDHRIFKDARTPWRHANRAIMALMKLDLYREGIDGEAVDWACQRLLAQPTRRKLLYVISDGCPMDSATHLANDESYLTRHLQQVLRRYQRLGVEICGIGVNLDLSRLYERALIANLRNGLDNVFIDEFLQSLARRTTPS